jgi:hypothetical protein
MRARRSDAGPIFSVDPTLRRDRSALSCRPPLSSLTAAAKSASLLPVRARRSDAGPIFSVDPTLRRDGSALSCWPPLLPSLLARNHPSAARKRSPRDRRSPPLPPAIVTPPEQPKRPKMVPRVRAPLSFGQHNGTFTSPANGRSH